MSRRKLAPKLMPDAELERAIISYKSAKDSEKIIKKDISELSSTIKSEFQNREITDFVAGDIQASISVTPKQEFNDLQAIEILRESLTPEQFSRCVKTREYIDEDEFEKLVYSHEVDAGILAPAMTILEPTVTLRLKKVKR